MTVFELWYGRNEPPREPRPLRAGPVTALLDGCDLRTVRIDGIEIVRQWYVAVRDHNWMTIPGAVSGLTVRDDGDRFEVEFEVMHRRGNVAFGWRGTIHGAPDGTIRYAMAGRADSAFRYNRIGFCVLHPPAGAAGRPYRALTHTGPISGELPRAIEPQRLKDGVLFPVFPACERLTIDMAGGVTTRFDFTGDLFEMEDQRNWTDASFKTYCTPLWQPYPKDATPGQRIDQSVTVAVERRPVEPAAVPATAEARLTVSEPLGRSLPPLGLGMASHGGDLTPREIDLLSRLNLDHLRVDLKLSDPTYPAESGRAATASAALGCRLELAIHLTDDAAAQLDRLAGQLRGGPPVARVLVFHTAEQSTTGRWVRLARERLHTATPDAEFAGGANAYFCQLNRSRPEVADMDAVVYSINPQVHAFDETSLVETLAAQAETVRSARLFSGGRQIVISPVTLKPRFNPNATGPDTPAPGTLPSPVDARQMSLFAAAWTLGSVKHLAEVGADSVTYFETTGWRGLIELAGGSPLPDLFRSSPGAVLPVYHVFADLADLKKGDLLACESSDPLAVEGVAIRRAGVVFALIANLTPRRQRVTISGLPPGPAHLRILDATSGPAAMTDPTRFRSESRIVDASTVELPPYATARMAWGS